MIDRIDDDSSLAADHRPRLSAFFYLRHFLNSVLSSYLSSSSLPPVVVCGRMRRSAFAGIGVHAAAVCHRKLACPFVSNRCCCCCSPCPLVAPSQHCCSFPPPLRLFCLLLLLRFLVTPKNANCQHRPATMLTRSLPVCQHGFAICRVHNRCFGGHRMLRSDLCHSGAALPSARLAFGFELGCRRRRMGILLLLLQKNRVGGIHCCWATWRSWTMWMATTRAA